MRSPIFLFDPDGRQISIQGNSINTYISYLNIATKNTLGLYSDNGIVKSSISTSENLSQRDQYIFDALKDIKVNFTLTEGGNSPGWTIGLFQGFGEHYASMKDIKLNASIEGMETKEETALFEFVEAIAGAKLQTSYHPKAHDETKKILGIGANHKEPKGFAYFLGANTWAGVFDPDNDEYAYLFYKYNSATNETEYYDEPERINIKEFRNEKKGNY